MEPLFGLWLMLEAFFIALESNVAFAYHCHEILDHWICRSIRRHCRSLFRVVDSLCSLWYSNPKHPRGGKGYVQLLEEDPRTTARFHGTGVEHRLGNRSGSGRGVGLYPLGSGVPYLHAIASCHSPCLNPGKLTTS